MDSLFYQLGELLASSSSSSSSGAERVDDDPGRLLRWPAPLAVAMVVLGLAVIIFPVTPLALVGYVILALAVAAVYDAVEIVQAYEKRTLAAFGDCEGILGPGLNVIPPFVLKTYRFDMRTQTPSMSSQKAITEDNSPVAVDAVVCIRVMDPECTFLQVDNYHRVVSLLIQTTLRAALGDMGLDGTLAHRDRINVHIRWRLGEPTDEQGVRAESVEVRRVEPLKDIENTMEQQTSIERHHRVTILETQDEHHSAVKRAEGDKQSNVIHAQDKEWSQILEVQGDVISTVLRACVVESMGGHAIIDKGMGTLTSIGTSSSTTYILPQELTSLPGRYNRGLSDSDVQQVAGLESKVFNEETHKLLGLDDAGRIFKELDDVETADISADVVDIEVEDGSVE